MKKQIMKTKNLSFQKNGGHMFNQIVNWWIGFSHSPYFLILIASVLIIYLIIMSIARKKKNKISEKEYEDADDSEEDTSEEDVPDISNDGGKK